MHRILVLSLVFQLASEAAAVCTWPSFFDVSSYAVDQDGTYSNSWEYETKVKTENARINSLTTSKKLVIIHDNNTMEMAEFKEENRTGVALFHKCEQEFPKDNYLLKRFRQLEYNENGVGSEVNVTKEYLCMRLVQRSTFVVQWALGDPVGQNMTCDLADSSLTNFPLVFWPIRNMTTVYRTGAYQRLLRNLTDCPSLGGYLMKVYKGDQTKIESAQCPHVFPSPRMEIACGAGEGLQLIPAGPDCPEYGSVAQAGAKMNCLASWNEGDYRFIVLVPDSLTTVNSFHCLRMFKDTSQMAIFFLDNVCQAGTPDANKVTFLNLELREKENLALCNDYSDLCTAMSADCSNPFHSSQCFKKCSAQCPFPNTPLIFPQDIRGTWDVASSTETMRVLINQDTLTLFSLGTFTAYGTPNGTVCLEPGPIFGGDSTRSYVLVTLADDAGCAPRIAQVSIRQLNSQVALLYNSGTSAMRNDEFSTRPDMWCHNNYLSEKKRENLYHPYWPYIASDNQQFPVNTGWFTMVKASSTDTDECGLLSVQKNLLMRMVFEVPDEEAVRCEVEVTGPNTRLWKISYASCNRQVQAGEVEFNCIGKYDMDSEHKVVILRVKTQNTGSLVFFPSTYYCLIVTSDLSKSFYVHEAERCDKTFVELVENTNFIKAKVKLDFVERISGSSKNMISFVLMGLAFSLVLELC